jgi:hypothetical protein
LGAEIQDAEKAREFHRLKGLFAERNALQQQARDLA